MDGATFERSGLGLTIRGTSPEGEPAAVLLTWEDTGVLLETVREDLVAIFGVRDPFRAVARGMALRRAEKAEAAGEPAPAPDAISGAAAGGSEGV